MLPPYELEGKVFKKAMKGYNTLEVDEHIDFIIEKYKELYRSYNDLEKRYNAVRAELMTYKENEESIRQTLENSQNSGAQLVQEAKDRSEIILKTARQECDAVIVQFRGKIQEEMETLQQLKKRVSEFKNSIFSQYQQHIEYLESISPDAADAPEQMDLFTEDILGEAIGNIVTNANRNIAAHEREQKGLISKEPVVEAKEINFLTADSLILSQQEKTAESDVATSDSVESTVADENQSPEEPAPTTQDTLPFLTDVSEPSNTGDTTRFQVTGLSPEISKAEDIIFGSDLL
jgi:cell division initiation protein